MIEYKLNEINKQNAVDGVWYLILIKKPYINGGFSNYWIIAKPTTSALKQRDVYTSNGLYEEFKDVDRIFQLPTL